MGNMVAARWSAVWLTMLVVLGTVAPLFAQNSKGQAISVRIYDYDATNPDQIRLAQRDVTQTFEAAGVALDWRESVSPDDVAAGKRQWPDDGVATLSVVILKHGVMPWRHAPRDVAGFAPITRERGGRVAYVLGDRVRDIVAIGGASPFEVMAGVITHEMAHLLMPARSHGSQGVLRANWKPGEFRRTDLRRFSADEVAALRGAVRAAGSSGARVAD